MKKEKNQSFKCEVCGTYFDTKEQTEAHGRKDYKLHSRAKDVK